MILEIERLRKNLALKKENFHFEALNQILNKGKFIEDKRGINYGNKVETLSNRKTTFVKGKEDSLSLEASSSTMLLIITSFVTS